MLTCCTLLLSGCALIDDNNDSFIRQTFLFEIEHRNYAWGHAWYGLYVDNEGTVYTYTLDASTRWEPASPDAFTGRELRDKFSHGREAIGSIDRATLLARMALISSAADGPLADPVDRCRDAGETAFKAFLYNARTDRYTPVLLRQEGDWAQKNRSPSADSLTTWLKTLDERFSYSFCAP